MNPIRTIRSTIFKMSFHHFSNFLFSSFKFEFFKGKKNSSFIGGPIGLCMIGFIWFAKWHGFDQLHFPYWVNTFSIKDFGYELCLVCWFSGWWSWSFLVAFPSVFSLVGQHCFVGWWHLHIAWSCHCQPHSSRLDIINDSFSWGSRVFGGSN